MVKRSLGTGMVTWDRGERIDDRYGFIYFYEENSQGESVGSAEMDIVKAKELADREIRGKLVAEVRETRESTHVGDWFHNVYPTTPEVGEVIELSEVGTFVVTRNYYGDLAVGIRPDDGRDTLWMNIRALYRVHEQTVELFLVEEQPKCEG